MISIDVKKDFQILIDGDRNIFISRSNLVIGFQKILRNLEIQKIKEIEDLKVIKMFLFSQYNICNKELLEEMSIKLWGTIQDLLDFDEDLIHEMTKGTEFTYSNEKFKNYSLMLSEVMEDE